MRGVSSYILRLREGAEKKETGSEGGTTRTESELRSEET